MLQHLAPQPLWQHFQQICAIPHPSYHEEALVSHLQRFADQQGLQHQRDKVGNLIIRKPATAGLEHAAGVVLQSHMDMVPQKSDDSNHDFSVDPIRPRVVDGWVFATDTTLGADNGIGVAAMLAVLQATDLEHGPLEALFTINEESGMDGAKGLQAGILKGELLLNLDSEQEGELYVGCAGGIDATAKIAMQRSPLSDERVGLKLIVRGLQGGHSGLDINLGRGNANQLLAELIQQLSSQYDLKLVDFNGGSLRNAIARRADALLAVSADQLAALRDSTQQLKAELKQRYHQTEPELDVGFLHTDIDADPLTAASQQQLIDAVLNCPHGMQRMHPSLEGVVETSNNLAKVQLKDTSVELQCLARSANELERDQLCQQIESRLAPLGATVTFDGAYPGWTPDLNAPLLDAMQRLHQQLFDQAAEVKVIHAGLECGLLAAAYPNWQMISFGPTIRFPHSPGEKVEIASVERFWQYLSHCLKKLAKLHEQAKGPQ
ncbi:MAG: aminoacyl-histidine dipeptidase [Halopseudomonas sp.]